MNDKTMTFSLGNEQEQEIRDMVPKVKRFIGRLDYMWDARERMGIKKEDYLGSYANDSGNNSRRWYDEEKEYAQKLETFIHSRMLNIDDAEYQICVLTKLGFRLSDIRHLTHLDNNNLCVMRTRLLTKLFHTKGGTSMFDKRIKEL